MSTRKAIFVPEKTYAMIKRYAEAQHRPMSDQLLHDYSTLFLSKP